MAIRGLIAFTRLGGEAQYSVDLAYRLILQSLHIVNDPENPLCDSIARKVLEVSERGVTNIVAISKIALRELELNGK